MSEPNTDVTLRIDRRLNTSTWNGSRMADRVSRLSRHYEEELLDQIEASLLNQESYDDFANRLTGNIGVKYREPQGPLGDMIFAVDNESRIAWGDALLRYNRQPDTVNVWAAELDESTTPGCWNSHGKYGENLHGATVPRHFGCRCKWLSVPNPESKNEEWAAMGRDVIEEMILERESGNAVAREAESPRWLTAGVAGASRFRSLRRLLHEWAEY